MAFGFAATSAPQPQGTSASSFKSHQELKTALHRDLLNKIDLEKLTSLQDVRARTQVQNVILDLIGAANVRSSDWDPSNRSCKMRPLPTFWSTPTARFTSSVAEYSNLPAWLLKMQRTYGTSLTRSCQTWDDAWMSRRRCATRAWTTARA